MRIDDMDLSPELREKAKACKASSSDGNVVVRRTMRPPRVAPAKAEGYKLSEGELAAVSGGGTWTCTDMDDSRYKPWKDCKKYSPCGT